MADVFLSYGRANQPQAAAIAGALEADGRSLWWDRRLATGEDYGQVIEREIDASRCVVVAWSGTARESLWVRAEANAALDQGKLVQLNLDGARLPLPFTMIHFLDFSTWSGAREDSPWPELGDRVGAHVRGEAVDPSGRRPDPGGIPWVPPPERALQGFEPVVVIGGAALAIALLLGILTIAAARGVLGGSAYGAIAIIALLLSLGLLAASAYITARTFQASRR